VELKDEIIVRIREFVAEYQRKNAVQSQWGEPLVGFAAAEDPLFVRLQEAVSPTHLVPEDVLAGARTVIAFFLPFPKSTTSTNLKERLASKEWAVCYVETNELIRLLSEHLQAFLQTLGHQAAAIPATHNWNEETLMSDWSHRHVAYIAGLGNFGLNNMLITEKGCSGRVGSLVTTLPVVPDGQRQEPACLYKYDGSCQKCVRKCVNDALFEKSFDRFKCYEMLLKNVDEHREVGYADVCGKCLVAVPCSHINPVQLKLQKERRKAL